MCPWVCRVGAYSFAFCCICICLYHLSVFLVFFFFSSLSLSLSYNSLHTIPSLENVGIPNRMKGSTESTCSALFRPARIDR